MLSPFKYYTGCWFRWSLHAEGQNLSSLWQCGCDSKRLHLSLKNLRAYKTKHFQILGFMQRCMHAALYDAPQTTLKIIFLCATFADGFLYTELLGVCFKWINSASFLWGRMGCEWSLTGRLLCDAGCFATVLHCSGVEFQGAKQNKGWLILQTWCRFEESRGAKLFM